MSKIVKEMIQGLVVVCLAVGLVGCSKKGSQDENVITNSGSDTMVNLAQMWAEEYQKVKPEISVEVGGGDSGVGIRDLMQGIVKIANASRAMKDSEKAQAKQNTGKEPVEWIVGYDALAVYVHKDNPVDGLTLAQLSQIYAESGATDK
jgi:phosphate transport system substrate-binding protein